MLLMRSLKLGSMWPPQHLIIREQRSDSAERSGSGFSLNHPNSFLFLSACPWALEAGMSQEFIWSVTLTRPNRVKTSSWESSLRLDPSVFTVGSEDVSEGQRQSHVKTTDSGVPFLQQVSR